MARSHGLLRDLFHGLITNAQTRMNTGVGERGRNRTFNLLIKSQLLCQLSYAPVCEETLQKGQRVYSISMRSGCSSSRRAVDRVPALACREVRRGEQHVFQD